MLQTTAQKDGDEWVINGHKWWTSDGVDADFLLVMARTDLDAHPYEGTSIILVPTDVDGVNIVRNVGPPWRTHGITELAGGHAEVKYENVRVPVENTVGNEGERVHNSADASRWRTAHALHAILRNGRAVPGHRKGPTLVRGEAFGSDLSEKQSLRHRIADAERRGFTPENDGSTRGSGTRPERSADGSRDGKELHRERDERHNRPRRSVLWWERNRQGSTAGTLLRERSTVPSSMVRTRYIDGPSPASRSTISKRKRWRTCFSSTMIVGSMRSTSRN